MQLKPAIKFLLVLALLLSPEHTANAVPHVQPERSAEAEPRVQAEPLPELSAFVAKVRARLRSSLALVLTVVLAGCGGSGGGSEPVPVPEQTDVNAHGRVVAGGIGGSTLSVYRVGDYGAPVVTVTTSTGATLGEIGKFTFAIPNVPSVVEAGLPEFQATAWNGLFAPKGTPQPVLDKLVDALNKALDDPETRKRLDVLGGDIPDKANRGPAPFHALVKSEIARWSPIIKAANVKMN